MPVGPGEKVLAGAVAASGDVVAGTRDALHLRLAEGTVRLPWERVQSADWDRETDTLTVVEVGDWGATRSAHEFVLAEPGRLLEFVRERVSASVVLQRHVALRGRRGVHVVARRAPGGKEPWTWVYEFDEGIDPDDPEVRKVAEHALARAQDEAGLR